MKRIQILPLLALLLTLTACASDEPPAEGVLAVYHEHTITQEMVDRNRAADAYHGENVTVQPRTDREIVDGMLRHIILMEEGEARGIVITEEDVEEFIASTLDVSYAMEEGKESIDRYCADNGMTLEEYRQRLREAAPSQLLRFRVIKDIEQRYYQKYGLDPDDLNPPQEVREAVQREEDAIFNAHQREIKYYLD